MARPTSTVVGSMPTAGELLGSVGDNATSYLVAMRLTSPRLSKPWVFRGCYLTGQPLQWPIGVKRSLVAVSFKTFPFIVDPYNAGVGHQGVQIWTRG